MKFGIENNIIASYKRLSYDVWYAFAEFIDNSTQAYFDNKAILDTLFSQKHLSLRVDIRYDYDNGKITISDNSMGMNESDLDKALKVGRPPENPTGRSKYGLGMKTAACWFGNLWSIRTKKLGEDYGSEVIIDVNDIASQESDINIPVSRYPASKDEHYTVITIEKLNRKLIGRTVGKIKEYLGSIYRFDFKQHGFKLFWNETQLKHEDIEVRLYRDREGNLSKRHFEFDINGKKVKGWVGVIGRNASRKIAGFSIVQNNRVIQNNYKPASLFGLQDEGSNDLVNQRLVGELFLDSFSVSHTKDKIVWEMDEEEVLDTILGDICSDMKELARTLRFRVENQRSELARFKEASIETLVSELKSNELSTAFQIDSYPEEVLATTNNHLIKKIQQDYEPVITVDIGFENDITHVSVFFNEISSYEPYFLSETAIEPNKIIIMINLLHPHLNDINSEESFTNFIRHSIYDAIAEWKTQKINRSNKQGNIIQPHTIKFFKDSLLRVPYNIKTNKI